MKYLADRHPEADLPHEHRKLLENAIESSYDMLELVDRLLDLSRLQSGKVELITVPVDLHTLGEETLKGFTHGAAEKGITLQNGIPKNATLSADHGLLKEVLRNLVSNAVKYCRKGDGVALFYESDGGAARFGVRDSGVGVDPRVLPDLFRHEVKTSTVGTAGERGTGLGLPFCGDIVNAHGWTINVESFPGKGAAFTIETG